eukprot:TRINITY_DN217_c0_g1_i10.p1 TRINITY_DN217_c0_g1~~TRINITY_DN217_c0_g1_i10.p1  ORF type:complete len:142 (+),score=4.13 TRINITY_DN217_c0_g1_i10:532-957(+)
MKEIVCGTRCINHFLSFALKINRSTLFIIHVPGQLSLVHSSHSSDSPVKHLAIVRISHFPSTQQAKSHLYIMSNRHEEELSLGIHCVRHSAFGTEHRAEQCDLQQVPLSSSDHVGSTVIVCARLIGCIAENNPGRAPRKHG